MLGRRVKMPGEMLWYRHNALGGTGDWVNGGQPQQIGSGWDTIRLIAPGGKGIIYAVR